MTFLLSPQFKKDVKKLPKSARKRIRNALRRLRDENRGDVKNIERDLWRLRVGDYRIYYYPENEDTYVLRAVHRKHAYKKFVRKPTRFSRGMNGEYFHRPLRKLLECKKGTKEGVDK